MITLDRSLYFGSPLLWVQIKVLFLSAVVGPVHGRVFSSSALGKQCCYEAALSPRQRLWFPWGEWGIPGELEGAAEGWLGCGGLCPEQERPDKQQRSWQSWEVAFCSTLRTLMYHPVYFPLVLQRLYGKLWAKPFARTLLSSPSSLPEHNGSMSVAGRVAKISDVSEKLIAARSGAGVGWSFVQPRAAGGAHCARKRKERHCCCRLGAGCRKQRIWGGLAIYRVSDFSDAQQLKTWLFFFTCLMKEVLGQVYASIIPYFTGAWKLQIHNLSSKEMPQINKIYLKASIKISIHM